MGEFTTVDTGKKCRVCGGRIVEEIQSLSRPLDANPETGPWGGTSEDGAYCEDCKIKYNITTLNKAEGDRK